MLFYYQFFHTFTFSSLVTIFFFTIKIIPNTGDIFIVFFFFPLSVTFLSFYSVRGQFWFYLLLVRCLVFLCQTYTKSHNCSSLSDTLLLSHVIATVGTWTFRTMFYFFFSENTKWIHKLNLLPSWTLMNMRQYL